MGMGGWIIIGGFLLLAGGKAVDAMKDPFHLEKLFHAELKGLHQRITSTANLNIFGSGTTDTPITPASGTLTLEGYQGRVV